MRHLIWVFYRYRFVWISQKFQHNIVNIFLSISFNICLGAQKNHSHRDGAFGYPQRMFWYINIFFGCSKEPYHCDSSLSTLDIYICVGWEKGNLFLIALGYMYLEAWECCAQVHMYILYIRLHVCIELEKIPQTTMKKQQQISVWE